MINYVGIAAFLVATQVGAAGIDVVFKIDESGSMGDDIADVKDNVTTIFDGLPAGSKVGLVGYGTTEHGGPNQDPHVHIPLTDDKVAFEAALSSMVANGYLEQGFYAVAVSAFNTVQYAYPGEVRDLGFTGAPYCNIMITDETPDQGGASIEEATYAMSLRDGIFFGVLPRNLFGVAQPLADATGGSLFDLGAFRADPQPVLAAVIEACVEAAIPVSMDVKPTSCPNPINWSSGKGVLPVALLGTEEFDVAWIDPESLRFNGECPAVRWAYEDVATPYEGEYSDPLSAYDCHTYAGDGFTDLSVKFEQACVVSTLAAPEGEQVPTLVNVTGTYTDADGNVREFTATDVVRVQ